MNQNQKEGQCRVSRGPLWISARLPHGSCQTVRIQRSESQSRPSRFLGSSQRCSSRGSCHSACRRRSDPGAEGDMGKWSSEACCSVEGPPTQCSKRSSHARLIKAKRPHNFERKFEMQGKFSQRKFSSIYIKSSQGTRIPQYFLYSPKMLQNLQECNTFHNIMIKL